MLDFNNYGKPITSQAIDKFRTDVFKDVGVEEDTDMDYLFQKAWKYGHEFGLEEVYHHFKDLVGIWLGDY